NEKLALSQYGQMTFTGLPALLTGTASFLYAPTPTPQSWRSLYGAVFVQDSIRVRNDLTVTLGFRDEFSTGWNEAQRKASNYVFVNGILSSQPVAGASLFTNNRAKFLPQPRVGLAWSPWNAKSVVRAGFGMYNDLQDALGYRADQNAPFNPVYSVGSASQPFAVSSLPINPSSAPPASAKLVPGGVQPDMKTPTLISW